MLILGRTYMYFKLDSCNGEINMQNLSGFRFMRLFEIYIQLFI